jgi:TonB-like protein
MKILKYINGFIYILASVTALNAQISEPKPVTGQKALKSMIRAFIDYPEYDLKSKSQGTVKIGFTTDKTGEVIEYSVNQHVSPGIDSSALSIFRLIIWNPATKDGKPIQGKSGIDIKYNIKSFEKIAKRRGYKHIRFPHLPVDTSGIINNIKHVTTLPRPIFTDEKVTLADYIYGELKYPEAAIKMGIAGEVELLFVIETNGLPSNIVAKKHLGGGCTEEAVRILQGIKWNPGLLKNEAVRTSYSIVIKFRQSDTKDGHIPNQQGSGI